MLVKEKICSITEKELLEDFRESIIDCVEGNLLDNLLTVDEEGNYIVYQECYLNCWTSGYIMISGEPDEVKDYWYNNIRRNENE